MGRNSYQGKTTLFLYEYNKSFVNYIEILREAWEEIKFKLNKHKVMRLMNNARYHCTTKALEFYSNNRVKVLD